MKYLRLYESFDFEETWIDEPEYDNIKIGDKVRVKSNLVEYIQNGKWSVDMYDMINKIYKVRGIDEHSKYGIIYRVEGNPFFIPKDCVEKVVNEDFDFEEVWEEEDDDNDYSFYPEKFKNFLIENGALEYFHENLKNSKDESGFKKFWYNIETYFTTFDDYQWIGQSFSWLDSPEGYNYWSNLDKKWRK